MANELITIHVNKSIALTDEFTVELSHVPRVGEYFVREDEENEGRVYMVTHILHCPSSWDCAIDIYAIACNWYSVLRRDGLMD